MCWFYFNWLLIWDIFQTAKSYTYAAPCNNCGQILKSSSQRMLSNTFSLLLLIDHFLTVPHLLKSSRIFIYKLCKRRLNTILFPKYIIEDLFWKPLFVDLSISSLFILLLCVHIPSLLASQKFYGPSVLLLEPSSCVGYCNGHQR